MSATLRGTSDSFGKQIQQIDLNITGHEKEIEALKTRRADFVQAKKVVDEALAKLPPEKQASPANPAPKSG